MFDEPTEDPAEHSRDPKDRAREKSDEFRMHAELAAVFEAYRKFDAEILSGLDPRIARDIQRNIGRLEKAKAADIPILPEPSIAEAAALLNLPAVHSLPTNDYHIYRRPGEVMIVRWLAGEQVETFYERLQAHFDAALNGYKDDERQMHEWKQNLQTLAYLAALDSVDVKMADRYLRDLIRQHNLFVLSTQTADEINISYLSNDIIGVSAAEIVGAASAPPDDEPTEADLAWFFKLFSLRGISEGIEQMCFFTYLQKVGDAFDGE